MALGTAAGALAAHAGLSPALQWLLAALCGAGTTAVWHFRRARSPRSAPPATNRDVNIDIGERVRVHTWNPDRSARVQYRGSEWTAHLSADADPRAGMHTIVAVRGNQLELAPLDMAPPTAGG
jgi:membrane protein implicated in regulation of membrane protease activity